MAKPTLAKCARSADRYLVATTDKTILVVRTCGCAERVLPCFEEKRPEDRRLRRAIEAARKRLRDGVFRTADIRGASLAAHAAVRDVADDDVLCSAARATGQVVATIHLATHSIAAAI